MAEIKITDLSLDGNDLFDDDEGFLDDLGEDMLEQVNGASIASPPIDSNTEPVIPKTTIIPFPHTIVIL